MMQAKALAVGHRQVAVLEGIDFSVRAGEVVGVVGRSGVGKSTLLACISGELPPLSGQVLVDGRPPRTWPSRERALRIGFLRQSPRVFGAFRVRDVVSLGRAPHGDAESKAGRQLCEQALDFFGIGHLATRICHTLSGGEQQRVHLARVLVQLSSALHESSGLLLLDEPTSALDLGAQEKLMQLLRRLSQQGTGVLLSLHDLNLALRRCDRVLLVGDRKPLGFGPPAEVLSPAMIREAFGVQVQTLQPPDGQAPVVIPC